MRRWYAYGPVYVMMYQNMWLCDNEGDDDSGDSGDGSGDGGDGGGDGGGQWLCLDRCVWDWIRFVCLYLD